MKNQPEKPKIQRDPEIKDQNTGSIADGSHFKNEIKNKKRKMIKKIIGKAHKNLMLLWFYIIIITIIIKNKVKK